MIATHFVECVLLNTIYCVVFVIFSLLINLCLCAYARLIRFTIDFENNNDFIDLIMGNRDAEEVFIFARVKLEKN